MLFKVAPCAKLGYANIEAASCHDDEGRLAVSLSTIPSCDHCHTVCIKSLVM